MLSTQPVESFPNLHKRVVNLLSEQVKTSAPTPQFALDLDRPNLLRDGVVTAGNDAMEFLDLVSAAMPDGDVYLFGGVLRDLALYGKKGFKSDIDLVVEGDWSDLVSYIEHLGARKNKFGGYRLLVGDWPVDIWNARDTWAIKHSHVKYTGITSLLETTVLNWDAVLMNWRTGNFLARSDYLETLRKRMLHVVLEQNPNPLGMAVRVFRHLCMKDARQISAGAANYLARTTRTYSFEQLRQSELQSYSRSSIEEAHYKAFKNFAEIEIKDDHKRWEAATEIVARQRGLWMHDLIAV
ncbi:MAG: hypothetical protein Q8L06_06485 [Pseudohongiella sp.]|nr:hypothetical protein [Pseudohongiella sp.]